LSGPKRCALSDLTALYSLEVLRQAEADGLPMVQLPQAHAEEVIAPLACYWLAGYVASRSDDALASVASLNGPIAPLALALAADTAPNLPPSELINALIAWFDECGIQMSPSALLDAVIEMNQRLEGATCHR
jgi:hypothetical protein